MRNNETVGVIVGRFQTASLHRGHRELFDYVLSKGHNLNVVVLGKHTAGQPTKRNPFDVDSRMRLINEAYPGMFTIVWLEDCPGDDKEWSKNLDSIIYDLAVNRDVILYGSRDSFAPYYKGKYNIEPYQQKIFCSATEAREHCGKVVHGSPEWRAGVIWATQNQFDKVHPTVDVAIFTAKDEILLGKKSNDNGYRFIGGFVDPTDKAYEDAAIREVLEETSLVAKNMRYVSNVKIDDGRYRHEIDKVITTFFVTDDVAGVPVASDDIAELHRLKFSSLREEDFIPSHMELYWALQNYFNR